MNVFRIWKYVDSPNSAFMYYAKNYRRLLSY